MDQSDKPFYEAIDDARGDRKIDEIAFEVEKAIREREDSHRRGASRSSFTKHAAGTARGSPSPYLMERVAEVLRIDARYFAEYRLAMERRDLDEREVGFEAALANLAKVRAALGLAIREPGPGEDEETLRLAAGEEIELPSEQDAEAG